MPPRSDKPAPRERLLEAADRLFYAEGIHAVGVDRVLAEAGVAKQSLYNHFASKDDLVLAVLERREQAVLDYFRSSVARQRERGKDPVDALFKALKDWFGERDFRGCAFINAAAQLPPPHAGAAFVTRHKADLHRWIRGLVRESAPAAPKRVAVGVALLLEGAIVTALIAGDPTAADAGRDTARAALAQFADA